MLEGDPRSRTRARSRHAANRSKRLGQEPADRGAPVAARRDVLGIGPVTERSPTSPSSAIDLESRFAWTSTPSATTRCSTSLRSSRPRASRSGRSWAESLVPWGAPRGPRGHPLSDSRVRASVALGDASELEVAPARCRRRRCARARPCAHDEGHGRERAPREGLPRGEGAASASARRGAAPGSSSSSASA